MASYKSANTEEEQDALLRLYQNDCNNSMQLAAEHKKTGDLCGVVWDEIMCWHVAPVGLHFLPCPPYIFGFHNESLASKYCNESGEWNRYTDFSQCYDANNKPMILVDVGVNETAFWETYIPLVRSFAHVGYGLSEVTLIVAFIILASFKKLRCPRNMLHLHLFVSFIMKAFMGFLKASLFEGGIGIRSDFLIKDGRRLFHQEQQGNVECKALTTLWQYFIAANYTWVLMEGLYIHNVIMWALSADSSSILIYIIMGWGLPMIYVPIWAVARSIWDDELCWTVSKTGIEYIIHIPTTISILINFGLFVNILRLLMSKLRTSIQEEAQRYWRLAKSTLVLVALFGVPYFIFFGLYFGNEKVHLVWLFCHQLFASFQGFFIALLYCYMNGEVQEELKKQWRKAMYNGRIMENNFPTTSFASWSSSYSMTYGTCSLSHLYDVSRRYLTCNHRPESRASKRTETVDCIVCETCSTHYDENKRPSLTNKKHCQEDDCEENGVEMKLMGHPCV